MIWLSRLIWFLLGFVACLVILLLVPLRLNWELKITDLLQVVITLLIAILIQKFATEAYSDKRVAKNLLIARVDETMSYFHEAHKTFLDCIKKGRISRDDSTAILSFSRNLNNSIKRLENGLVKCKITAPALDVVKQHRRDYNRALTGGGFPSQPYAASALSDENELYNTITDALESMRYEINNR